MISFVDMRRCEPSIDGETLCRYMKDDREQEEKAGQHGGEGREQCTAMVTDEPSCIMGWALRLALNVGDCGRGEGEGRVGYVICFQQILNA
jgi:hypothetical protein